MTPKSLLAPARLAGVPLLRSQSDERLVDLVRAGNDAAFEAIVARYRRPLLRHCSRMLSDERAEDVVQQAFVRALAAMRRDERPLDLKPWLYTIAHNAALNALRERAVPSDTLEEEIDGVERPEQAYERREGLRTMVAAVSALPARQRDALVLRELEGRSYEEIAAELGVTGGAVRQLLNRARTSLRAGVTALTPMGLLLRIPVGPKGPLAERLAELSAASAGVGTVAAKAAAGALVAGALIGGVAAVPGGPGDLLPPPVRGAVAEAGKQAAATALEQDEAGDDSRRGASSHRGGRDAADADGRRGGSNDSGDDRDGRRGGDDRDSSGSGSSGDSSGSSGPSSGDDRSGSSGPGSGDSVDNSGPGGGGDEMLADGNSGPGSSGSDSSGSGSGTSGSGTSGSDSSGSGSSGSGSGSSGSGSLDDRSGSNSGPG
jgi:RNA polymerase sigma factor (sigma-70 family)